MFNEEFDSLEEGFLGDIFSKIGGFIKKVAKKIVELAKKGISAILKFFGLVPDKIEVSNVVIV